MVYLPMDIILNILEYDPHCIFHAEYEDIADRIHIIDPSYQIGRITHDNNLIEVAKSNIAYKLFMILRDNHIHHIHMTEECLEIHPKDNSIEILLQGIASSGYEYLEFDIYGRLFIRFDDNHQEMMNGLSIVANAHKHRFHMNDDVKRYVWNPNIKKKHEEYPPSTNIRQDLYDCLDRIYTYRKLQNSMAYRNWEQLKAYKWEISISDDTIILTIDTDDNIQIEGMFLDEMIDLECVSYRISIDSLPCVRDLINIAIYENDINMINTDTYIHIFE